MSALQEYKCPCCGGAIAFDSGTQKMKCPYCDTEFEVEALESYQNGAASDVEDDMNWGEAAGGAWKEGEADGLRSFVCKSCGGEIVGDETTAAASCPFCGNSVIMTGQLSGALKPDCIIPFKLDETAAKSALQKHYGGKRLLPKVFKDQNHIDEIKGVYVPFWLFDADAQASIRYKATRVRTYSDSDYHYKETSCFSVSRGGVLGFERVPVDGSSKMPDELMESIEPFSFSDAVDFKTAYLAGYLAEYREKKKTGSLTGPEEDALKDMRIVEEMYARGFRFVPIDIYKAKARRFQIIDGKIMPSFKVVSKIGEVAGESIEIAAEKGKFLSKEDLKNRAKVGQTVIDKLDSLHLLDGMSESNQLSIFDMMGGL